MKKVFFLFLTFLILSCTYAQNVGIGTTNPVSKLTIQTPNNTEGFTHVSDGGIVLTDRVGGVSASIGTSSNHAFRLMANNNPIINLDVLGNVGVGLTDQTYKMDIADRIRIRSGPGSSTAGIWFNNPSNSSAFAFAGTKDVDQFGIFGTNAWNFVMNTNSGNIGIGANVPNPTNKLQIGSVGLTGFATNDLAIGNGTNALGIFQSNTSTYIGSTTDIVLMPRNNGQGRIGINTTAPRAPLDVVNTVSVEPPNSEFAYYAEGHNSSFSPIPLEGGSTDPNINVSIYASDRILASEFDAYSDTRIKSIVSVTNTTKDLETINALQITDYTMKDKVKYGNKPFKKVIAQEVEKVYPQIVSKHTDFIPNVYQVTSKLEKTTGGYLLSFNGKHNISKTAKKLRVLLSEGEGMQQFYIVSLPSEYQVLINTAELKTDKVFVYGEEVDDFRTVDYEGLTTLNISATQELSKLVKQQQAAMEVQSLQIAGLTQAVKSLKERGCADVQ